jgi:hypothetical protein
MLIQKLPSAFFIIVALVIGFNLSVGTFGFFYILDWFYLPLFIFIWISYSIIMLFAEAILILALVNLKEAFK